MRISQVLFPRLVGLVTTCGREGKPNVATFSFIMPVSFEPKYLAFSISAKRYSFKNLEETKEFVLNIPTKDMLDKVWICGSYSGRDVNKFEKAKLETEKSKVVKPPRIKGCSVQLECKIEFMKEFGDHHIVVGKVVEEHVEKEKFEPILHFSGNEFFTVGKKVKI